MTHRFIFDVRLETSLSVEEIWPDGDAPENPTSQDVIAQLRKSGSDLFEILSDWNLSETAELTVSNAKDWIDKESW